MCTKCGSTGLDCCTIMGCVNIESSDNSISVEKSDCGVDLKFLPNNLDSILEIKDGDCIQMQKEFINNKLTITPILDLDCLAAAVCNVCQDPVTCPAPIHLTVVAV